MREKPGIHDYIQIKESTERPKEVLFFLCNQNPAHFMCILSFNTTHTAFVLLFTPL